MSNSDCKSDYKKEMLSLIVTIFNEADSLPDFLQSIEEQKLLPDEVIIVDADSSDESVKIIQKFQSQSNLKIILIQQNCSRAVGRNLAAKKAKGQWLAITDAGTVLDKNWLLELIAEQGRSQVPVVAGYYRALATSKLAAAIAPYFMVTKQRFDEKTFLPATRSMLIKKSLWEELGGLDESLAYAEDYPLAQKIKKTGVKIGVAKKAVVNWLPPDNFLSFFKTIVATAQYDVIARVIRFKIYLVFARYLIFFLILLFFCNFLLIISLMTLYLLWSILKNYQACPQAWYYLPLLQVLADLGVMWGSIKGVFSRQTPK